MLENWFHNAKLITQEQWRTSSSSSTRPNSLLDIWSINIFTPHAYLSTDDQFLLLRICDILKWLIYIELLPTCVYVVQVPTILVANNAS